MSCCLNQTLKQHFGKGLFKGKDYFLVSFTFSQRSEPRYEAFRIFWFSSEAVRSTSEESETKKISAFLLYKPKQTYSDKIYFW